MNPSLFPALLAANKYRLIDYDLPAVFGMPSGPLIVLGLVVLSVVLGTLIANAARMRDYGWKIGLIFGTVLVSIFVVLFGDFKLGVDLKGGVILVYEVNEIETEQLRRGARDKEWSMGQLLTVLKNRLNPTGLKEIVIRPFGPKQVEIVVPEVDPAEIEKIKENIRTAGVLRFMIVASDEKDSGLFETARAHAQQPDFKERMRRDVKAPDGQQVGYWAILARDTSGESTYRAYDTLANGYLRDARTGEVLELTSEQKRLFMNSPSAFDAYLKERGAGEVDVLMVFDEDFEIKGNDLANSYAGHDETFRPAIHFSMKTEGSLKMGHVTQEYLRRKLAIIFDNKLLSAPVIQSKITDVGQITGNFSQEEVDFIVDILDSGSMPVVMQKDPISENRIGSILGLDTIRKGSWSVVIALGLILVFMAAYYRVSGLIASFALVLNLLLTIGIMVLLQAPLTLPGLAGLVLTVAMSVDANVLISERMREELARGATLRMAIRNGFDKALSAIIDGNLTTFLTALVLYSIGTDQVKGFGMTLMLGNITSMFTAIFCARVILDVGERTRWLKTLSMASILTNPRVDWVRFFGPAVVGSFVLIVIGAVATVARGKGLWDTDLAGGTSVVFLLKQPMPEDTLREKLDVAFGKMTENNARVNHDVYGLSMEGQPPDTVYKVDSSLEEVKTLQDTIRDALKQPNGQDALKTFEMLIGQLEESPLVAAPASLSAPGKVASTSPVQPAAPVEKSKSPATDDAKKATPKTEQPLPPEAKTPPQPEAKAPPLPEAKSPPEPAAKEPPDEKKGDAPDCGEALQEEAAKTQPAEPPPPAAAPTNTTDKSEPPPAAAPPAAAAPTAAAAPAPDSSPAATALAAEPSVEAPTAPSKLKTKLVVRFPGSPISAAALQERLNSSARETIKSDLAIEMRNTKWDGLDNSAFEEWTVTLPVDKEQAAKVVQHAKSKLEGDVAWQTSSKIGGQVSADTRWRALGALGVSLLGIIAYVWFRFQNVAWGLAAVAALAHDALVMLTGIAVSYWLAGPLGFLGVEEFKISLPVVAAFLAILGYSVNDTIVIFDRLREIRGKSPRITREMLNASVNETLSRTIILAGITLTVVLILYAFGGPGIHAFAFAMVVGVISGCYTTLVIASPMVLWLLNRQAVLLSGEVPNRETKKSVA